MSYATLAELKAVIPVRELALLSDHAAGATPDDQRLQDALDDASAEIDGYISRRVALPIQNPPRMLTVKCRDIAMYRLYAAVGRVSETQAKLYDAALAYLGRVARGELSIGDETPGAGVPATPGAVVIDGPERTMTRDGLRGF